MLDKNFSNIENVVKYDIEKEKGQKGDKEKIELGLRSIELELSSLNKKKELKNKDENRKEILEGIKDVLNELKKEVNGEFKIHTINKGYLSAFKLGKIPGYNNNFSMIHLYSSTLIKTEEGFLISGYITLNLFNENNEPKLSQRRVVVLDGVIYNFDYDKNKVLGISEEFILNPKNKTEIISIEKEKNDTVGNQTNPTAASINLNTFKNEASNKYEMDENLKLQIETLLSILLGSIGENEYSRIEKLLYLNPNYEKKNGVVTYEFQKHLTKDQKNSFDSIILNRFSYIESNIKNYPELGKFNQGLYNLQIYLTKVPLRKGIYQ